MQKIYLFEILVNTENSGYIGLPLNTHASDVNHGPSSEKHLTNYLFPCQTVVF